MSEQTQIPFSHENNTNTKHNDESPAELKPLFEKFNRLYLETHKRYRVSKEDFQREPAMGGIGMTEQTIYNYRRPAYSDRAELDKIHAAGINWSPATNRTVRIKIERLQDMAHALQTKHIAGGNTIRTPEELKEYITPRTPVASEYESAVRNSVARKGFIQSARMEDALKAEALASESVIRTPPSANVKAVTAEPQPNAWHLANGNGVLQVLGKPGSYSVLHLPDGSFVVSAKA